MRQPLPDPVREVIEFYEALSPASLHRIAELYAPAATFKDPFNHVSGPADIRRVFDHMFATVQRPRFKVLGSVVEDQQAWLTWDFLMARAQGDWVIHGATHLVFDAQGRVVQHRDYWDPVEGLYAKLPVVGTLMRWLTRHLSATAGQAAP